MVTLYQKKASGKRFSKVKRFKTYHKCYGYVCEKLMEADYRLYLSYNLQYLKEGYGKKRIFPYASHQITRKGITYKIKI